MAFLSISIDLGASTHIKQVITELGAKNGELRREMYQDYLRLLYGLERQFYQEVLSSRNVDADRLYLVKTIGDEFWYVHELDTADPSVLEKTALAYLEAILRLFATERYLAFEWLPEGRENRSLPRMPARQIQPPLKAFVDLITEPIELNAERYVYIKDVIPSFTGADATILSIDEDYLGVCQRLNLYAQSLPDNQRTGARKDYIGLEVDRFFRLTHLCMPQLLGVGEALLARLPHAIKPAAPDLEHIGVKVMEFALPDGALDSPSTFRKYLISQPVPASQMKGLSSDYTLHHIFGEKSLGESIYAPPPDMETLLEPTRAFLAEHGFYALERLSLLP